MSPRLFLVLFLILAAVGALAPFFGYPVELMKVLCLGLFACAFNLLLGYTGLLSFGHAAFFGGAAYAAGYAIKDWGLTPELAILLGTGVSAVLGFVVGSLAIRRQGIYFAMITLALAQMVYFFCLQAKFTGGEDGLQGVPRGSLFGLIPLDNDLTLYYVVLAIFLAAFLLVYRIVHSPFGQILKAIRENEPRALSLGYNVDRYKLLAFVLSAALSGTAGATKTVVFGFATLTDVNWPMSGEVVLMTLLGGLGTIFGPVVGSTVIETLNYQFAGGVPLTIQLFLTNVFGVSIGTLIIGALNALQVQGILGVIFVVCVLLFRRGIVGVVISIFEGVRVAVPPRPRRQTVGPQ
jgi:branched-chain amino acid transport system permease protein